MQTGLALGMCTMDSSIYTLYKQQRITEETARKHIGGTEFDKMQEDSTEASEGAVKKKGWLR